MKTYIHVCYTHTDIQYIQVHTVLLHTDASQTPRIVCRYEFMHQHLVPTSQRVRRLDHRKTTRGALRTRIEETKRKSQEILLEKFQKSCYCTTASSNKRSARYTRQPLVDDLLSSTLSLSHHRRSFSSGGNTVALSSPPLPSFLYSLVFIFIFIFSSFPLCR